MIKFYFDIVDPYGIICRNLKRFSFSLEVFFILIISWSSPEQFPYFVTWSIRTVVFLPIFVFQIFCFTFCLLVDIAVICCFNLSFFLVFCAYLELLHLRIPRCWRILFQFLFLTHRVCLSSLRLSYRRDCLGIYFFHEIFAALKP